MIIFAAVIAAVVTFLLAIIAAAITAPLAALDSYSSWALLNQAATWAIVIGPLGLVLLGIFVASGAPTRAD